MKTVHETNWIKLLVFASLTIALFISFFRYFNADEFEAIHTTWKIWQGGIIYTDFFQHHHPFFYYMLVPIFWFLGESMAVLFVARIIVFIMFLGILYTSYSIAKIIFNKNIAWLSLLLLSTTVIFIDKAIEIRPDVPQTLFGLLSILFYFQYKKNEERSRLLISSLCLALSFLFLQKAIFLVLLFFMLLVFELIQKNIHLKNLFLFALVFLATVIPYFTYLVISGVLNNYITFAWTVNLLFNTSFPFYVWAFYTSAVNIILVLFYFFGLIQNINVPTKNRLIYFSLGLLASIAFSPLAFRQYFMPALPLISIIAASSLFLLKKHYQILYYCILVFTFTVGHSVLLINTFYKPNIYELVKIDYIHKLTSNDETILSNDNHISLFRNDLDFFWFSTGKAGALSTYRTIADYHYDIYELIDQKKPRAISIIQINNLEDPRIKDHYLPSPVYTDIYIRKK